MGSNNYEPTTPKPEGLEDDDDFEITTFLDSIEVSHVVCRTIIGSASSFTVARVNQIVKEHTCRTSS